MAHPICRSDGARPSAPGRFRFSIRNARRAPAAGEPGPCAHMRSPKEATFSCLSRGDVLPLFQWSPARENAALSGCSDIALPIAPSRSPPDERGVRLTKFEREQLIVDFLNRGHVGRRDHSADRRRRKAHARPHPGPPDWDPGFARRIPHPPEAFVAIQVGPPQRGAARRHQRHVGDEPRSTGWCGSCRNSTAIMGLSSPPAGAAPKPDSRIIPGHSPGTRGSNRPRKDPRAYGGALVCRVESAVQDGEDLAFGKKAQDPPRPASAGRGLAPGSSPG